MRRQLSEGDRTGRLRTLWDAVRSQLWPVPAAGTVAAVPLGVWLPNLDAIGDDATSAEIGRFLFGGAAGAARTVLDAIASSLITVTSLTFSLTVVTLQLASSQFSPRLLRTFTRDRIVHVTLALFLSTFTYALTVLRSVRADDNGQQEFVPRLAVTFSFVLAVASVIALVSFLAHLARQLRVETMLHAVHEEGSATIRELLQERPADGSAHPDPPSPSRDAVTLSAPASGFLTRITEDEILAAVVEDDAIIVVDTYPGSFWLPAHRSGQVELSDRCPRGGRADRRPPR